MLPNFWNTVIPVPNQHKKRLTKFLVTYILGNRRKRYHQFEHVERPWLMGMMDYHVQGDYNLMLLKMLVMKTNRDFEFGRWLEPSGPTLFPRFFFFFSLLCHRWPSLPPPPGSVSCQNKIWIFGYHKTVYFSPSRYDWTIL